jgi:hypothetical protein
LHWKSGRKEKKLRQTNLFYKRVMNNFSNPTKEFFLPAGTIGYDADLDFEKLKTIPRQRITARIASIEAEIQSLEKEIGGVSE